MSKQADPFSGKSLSSMTPLTGVSSTPIDQRLFASAANLGSVTDEHPVTASHLGTSTPEAATTFGHTSGIQRPKSREVGKEASREVGREGKREVKELFDINERPYRKDSFLFTDEEFEALEDTKTELRRHYDLKGTKNDIARCAIQHLLADFKQGGENSVLVRKLHEKQG